MPVRPRLAGVALLAACGPGAPAGSATQSDASTTTNGLASSSSEAVDDTTRTGMDAPDTTSEAMQTTTGTTGGPTEPVCEPAPERFVTSIVVDGLVDLGSDWEAQYDCTVGPIADGPDGATQVALDCIDDEGAPVSPSLAITTDPPIPIPIAVGDDVRIDVFRTFGYWTNLFLALRDPDGEILVAYADAEALPGGDGMMHLPAADFFAPLALGDAWPCEPECEERVDPPDDGIEECECVVRKAVDFAVGDETTRVMDGGSGTHAGAALALRVDRDRAYQDIGGGGCGLHEPGAWLRVVAVRTR